VGDQGLESVAISQTGWNSYLRNEGKPREGFTTRSGMRQGETLMQTVQVKADGLYISVSLDLEN